MRETKVVWEADCQTVVSMKKALKIFIDSQGTRAIFAAILVFGSVYQYGYGWTWSSVVLVVSVFFFWSVPEWWMHKYPMHHSRLFALPERWHVLYRVHMAHHRDPGNMEHALLRPVNTLAGILLVALLTGLLCVSFRAFLLAGICGFLIAINYNFVHFLSHTAVESHVPLLRQALINHRQHHGGKRGGYCLSNIWMDYLMGTILRR